jgi:PAS domain S-box-containing protein
MKEIVGVSMVHDGMFKELVENSDDIVIVTDREFKIRYITSSVEKVFGIEPLKVLGSNIFSFVSPEKKESWRGCLTDPSFSSFKDEISLRLSGDSWSYFDIEASNLFNSSPVGGLVLKLHDITEKKSKEKELVKSNRQLDQVIYKTTHDLKAPLMSALGLIRLAENSPDGEKVRYLELIKKSLLKLDSFINEMNNFFRNEKLAIQRMEIDMEGLLRSELDDVKNLYLEEEIDIRLNVRESAVFYSDDIRVKTIAGNLLSNAIKYRDTTKAQSFIDISVSIDQEICELRFVDNGIGIEPQYGEKIFDLFFRATEQSQGTGLGLFIVKDTIERLKGTINVQSTPGEGTAFTIRIPNQILQSVEAD